MYLSQMSTGSSTCPSASMTLYGRPMAVLAFLLFAEPDGVELLVEEVAWRDRPATHLRQMRHDAMPLEAHDEVHFLVVEPLLILAQETAPLLGNERPRLPGVQVVHHGVLVLAVVHRRRRDEPVDVEIRLDDRVARRGHRDFEVTAPQRLKPGGRFHGIVFYRDTDLPPLVDEPDAERLVGLRHRAVEQREGQVLDAGLLEETTRFGPGCLDVMAVAGQLLQLGGRRRPLGAGHLDAGDLLDQRDA